MTVQPIDYVIVFDKESFEDSYPVSCTGGPQRAAQIAFEDNFCDDADALTYGVDTLVMTPDDEKYLFNVKGDTTYIATQIRGPLPHWAIKAHVANVYSKKENK